MSPSTPILLREVHPQDREIFYLQQLDAEANWMAAFVSKDPADRESFEDHWDKILASPQNVNRTVLASGQVAGHIACYPNSGHLEVTYWLGREFWGKGIATGALRLMLGAVTVRPLLARTAKGNPASLRVLQKCGFVIVGEDRGFAHGRGGETEELHLRLDGPGP